MSNTADPVRWTAQMIAPDEEFAGAPILRREFALDSGHGRITRAVLHATARGIVTASVNGTPVSDDVLTPGWSSYEWRLRYRSYDVTRLLGDTSPDRVVLGLELGNGWFRGRLGWTGERQIYGTELGALAQLEIDFDDGHRQTVITDESWRAGPSAVIANDLYDGQTVDARRHETAWQSPGFAADRWVGVHALRFDAGDPDCVRRTAGPPAAGHRGTTGLAIAHGTHPGRLRAEPGRVGAVRRCRRPWSHHHGPLRRGARRRGAGDAALAQRAGHRPVHPLRRPRTASSPP